MSLRVCKYASKQVDNMAIRQLVHSQSCRLMFHSNFQAYNDVLQEMNNCLSDGPTQNKAILADGIGQFFGDTKAGFGFKV